MPKTTEAYETKTKIVATLGPASWAEPRLSDLLRRGVDVCRINCSHANHDSIRKQVAAIRKASESTGLGVAILLDLQGPKVRTGPATKSIELQKGDVLTIVMDEHFAATGKRGGTTYPNMAKDVSVGTAVLFADGALSGEVSAIRLDVTPAEVDVRMDVGGPLGSHKGINLPGIELTIPSLTDKDKGDLAAGLEAGVDYVAMSFVQHPGDVVRLKDAMRTLGHELPVVAKIEKPTAVERIKEICAVSEAIMVARGDLGVEVSLEKVPIYQKRIIQAAFEAKRIVITATQMLDSMERSPRPTRAETTDVANAILDGTDAVMLSGETAIGKHPLEAVRVMDQIAREVESSEFFGPRPLLAEENETETETVLRAASFAAQERGIPLVIFNWTGDSAVAVSKARGTHPIYALTADSQVYNRLQLVWGVTPLLTAGGESLDELIAAAERALLSTDQVAVGECVVMVTGHARLERAQNVMKLHVMKSK